jgi:hypothetical protein
VLQDNGAVGMRGAEIQNVSRSAAADRYKVVGRIIALCIDAVVCLGNRYYASSNGQLGGSVEKESPLEPKVGIDVFYGHCCLLRRVLAGQYYN